MIPQDEIHPVENVVSNDDENDETEDLNDVANQTQANVSQLCRLFTALRQQDMARCVDRHSKKEKCLKIQKIKHNT
ncbi:hypothetical protein TNCT_524411 [Trichonephila clavata]|uniref:Uncharacterized protein n=1 Tax=Trichonephila clavata TaxID=2740835 RepID=A0A8X6H048_TRICU|nr:hypothetical protein TNCT_524411 [Trichonephila clavata]